MFARIAIFGGRRRDADAGEDRIFPQVMAKIVEIVRTIPVDVSVPRNRRPLRSYGGRDTQRTIEQSVHVTVLEIPEQTARVVKFIPQELDTAIQMQKTVKDAQAQYIGKIVCVAGNEIDRKTSTTHSGMHASSSKKNLMKTETEEIFRSSTTAIPEALLRSCRRIGTFS